MGNSSWDELLLKKYGTTSHFKLLSQLRTEIKNYPINRVDNNSSTNQKVQPNTKQFNTKTKEGLDEKNTVAKSQTIYSNVKDFKLERNPPKEDTYQKLEPDSSISFKDRLRNIDMR
tara:strand:- start:186 stop:533 length:348 start_codon:yes stop_codon:yes gene_type:complete